MNLPDGLLPFIWEATGFLLLLPVLVWLITRLPWQGLREHPWYGGVFLLFLAGVAYLWAMQAGLKVNPGLNLHLLGATVLVLAFGWQLALLGLMTVLAVLTAAGQAGWEVFALNALLMAVLPVAVAAGFHLLVYHKVPNHPFVYIFLNAFLGAGLTITAVVLASAATLNMAGVYTWAELIREYVRYLPLVIFPEAFISGGVMAILVVYKPQWVVTFDDDLYLKDS
jgi:uncharacterized membrane protein